MHTLPIEDKNGWFLLRYLKTRLEGKNSPNFEYIFLSGVLNLNNEIEVPIMSPLALSSETLYMVILICSVGVFSESGCEYQNQKYSHHRTDNSGMKRSLRKCELLCTMKANHNKISRTAFNLVQFVKFSIHFSDFCLCICAESWIKWKRCRNFYTKLSLLNRVLCASEFFSVCPLWHVKKASNEHCA